jgi:hypothetical protein
MRPAVTSAGGGREMRINFGYKADPLYKQLGLPRKKLEQYQNTLFGINFGNFTGIITDAEYRKILHRLEKKLTILKDPSDA